MNETFPLPLEQALRERRCRICGGTIAVNGTPVGFESEFGRMIFPIKITLNWGQEFAHTDCLGPRIQP